MTIIMPADIPRGPCYVYRITVGCHVYIGKGTKWRGGHTHQRYYSHIIAARAGRRERNPKKHAVIASALEQCDEIRIDIVRDGLCATDALELEKSEIAKLDEKSKLNVHLKTRGCRRATYSGSSSSGEDRFPEEPRPQVTTTLHPAIERLIVLVAEEQVARALREAQKEAPSDATNVEGVSREATNLQKGQPCPNHIVLRSLRSTTICR